jgi:hypothetical protein
MSKPPASLIPTGDRPARAPGPLPVSGAAELLIRRAVARHASNRSW